MKFLLGQKKEMTQIFQEDGTATSVTVIQVDPNVVTDLRQTEKDGYTAVQLGYGHKAPKLIAKPQLKQWGELGSFRWVKEFRLDSTEGFERGKKLDATVFEVGDVVNVTGVSKGKGYTGVVKRHHFAGAPATHGHKHDLRAPGSIGATFPQKVLKGTRMAGRMGNARSTNKNLKIAAVHPESNQLLIEGPVAGPRNGLVMIQSA